jgi:hypothetical protein
MRRRDVEAAHSVASLIISNRKRDAGCWHGADT